mmetsp:Transcript_41001/g.68113  ORF Transcript_41001/g.68113 Transcript_41001/m.68113 type:complete len:87 (+) Transcript_41001:42-302(+)
MNQQMLQWNMLYSRTDTFTAIELGKCCIGTFHIVVMASFKSMESSALMSRSAHQSCRARNKDGYICKSSPHEQPGFECLNEGKSNM